MVGHDGKTMEDHREARHIAAPLHKMTSWHSSEMIQSQSALRKATERGSLRESCVPQLIADQAAATPDADAVAAGAHLLTYRELDRRANQLGNHLRAMGVGPEVVVGLCLERSVDFVVAALAILKAGGAYLPLDPAYPTERLAFMLTDARTPVLVTRQGLTERLARGTWRTVAVDADRADIAQQPNSPPAGAVAADALAYVIYTSGSTGEPKGVEITHESLLHLVFWHRQAFTVTRDDRATQIASPAFDAAVWELWPYLTAGACVSVPDEETRLSPDLLRDWLVIRGITICFLPTPLAEIAMTLEWPTTTTLRMMLTGGDRLHTYPPPTLPFAVINNYGPAENTVVATSGPVPPTAEPLSPPSIGRPIPHVEDYILDADLRPVAEGVEGELHLGGVGLARGYRHRPQLTAERFIPNPFSAVAGARLYKTGDIARYRPDGGIDFVGRADEQVKIRGYRIELGEITTVLDRHPAVRTSHVAIQEHAPGDVRLVAYVVPIPAHEPTAGDLQAFLGTYLPEYMVPTTFVRIAAMPVTANGKVEQRALPAPDATNSMWERRAEPSTPLERELTAIIATMLNLEQVGRDDNFFLLGGHSLLGAHLISRVRDTFGVDLPLLTLFEAPTVASLAIEIEQLIVAYLEAMSDDEARRLLA